MSKFRLVKNVDRLSPDYGRKGSSVRSQSLSHKPPPSQTAHELPRISIITSRRESTTPDASSKAKQLPDKSFDTGLALWASQESLRTARAASLDDIIPEDPIPPRQTVLQEVVVNLRLIVVLGIYALCGAALFQKLEQADFVRAHQEYMEHSKRVLNHTVNIVLDLKLDCDQRRNDSEIEQACHQEISRVLKTNLFNETGQGLFEPKKHYWDFVDALCYALTIFTTIGYGHLACRTPGGQIFSMLYATVGIPLMFAVLEGLGHAIHTTCFRVYNAVRIRLCCSCQLNNKTTKNPICSCCLSERVPLWFLGTAIFCYSSLLAGVMMQIEGWTFMIAFYYVFITISTIGFGDVVPSPRGFAIFPMILFGLALLALFMNKVQQILLRMMQLIQNCILYQTGLYNMPRRVRTLLRFTVGVPTTARKVSTDSIDPSLSSTQKTSNEFLEPKPRIDSHDSPQRFNVGCMQFGPEQRQKLALEKNPNVSKKPSDEKRRRSTLEPPDPHLLIPKETSKRSLKGNSNERQGSKTEQNAKSHRRDSNITATASASPNQDERAKTESSKAKTKKSRSPPSRGKSFLKKFLQRHPPHEKRRRSTETALEDDTTLARVRSAVSLASTQRSVTDPPRPSKAETKLTEKATSQLPADERRKSKTEPLQSKHERRVAKEQPTPSVGRSATSNETNGTDVFL